MRRGAPACRLIPSIKIDDVLVAEVQQAAEPIYTMALSDFETWERTIAGAKNFARTFAALPSQMFPSPLALRPTGVGRGY